MTSSPRHRRSWGAAYSAVLLLLTFLIVGGCGTGTYNDRMERRVQELNSRAAEQPDESDEAADDAPAPRRDDSDDELLEDDIPPADEDEELLEDEVPELNEPIE